MRKLVLLLMVSVFAFEASAQISGKTFGVQPAPYSPVIKRATINPEDNAVNKGTGSPAPRWYNHANGLGIFYSLNMYDTSRTGYYAMWQDSSVTYPGSAAGINYLSIGQIFHPQSSIYTNRNIPANVGQQHVTTVDSYIIDSIKVRGIYIRTNNTYVDTLIFTIVTETPTRKFPYGKYGGSTLADHGTDSFAYQLWNSADYLLRPISQVSYSISGLSLSPVTQIKAPLNNATFADSLSDGSHEIKVAVGVNISASCKSSLSITFKSGAAYTPGTPITNYNYFAFLSHETNPGGFVMYPVGDDNMSSVIYKDTSYTRIDSARNMYASSLAWTAPFAAEVHNISFKVSCPYCRDGVKDISKFAELGNVYPNPADDNITLPIRMNQTADVSVSISSITGQVLATKNLGKLSANQSTNASFSTASLASGMYFLMVTADGARATSRFIVSH